MFLMISTTPASAYTDAHELFLQSLQSSPSTSPSMFSVILSSLGILVQIKDVPASEYLHVPFPPFGIFLPFSLIPHFFQVSNYQRMRVLSSTFFFFTIAPPPHSPYVLFYSQHLSLSDIILFTYSFYFPHLNYLLESRDF